MSKAYDLAYKRLDKIQTLLASGVANADYVIMHDVSANLPVRVLAASLGIQKSAAAQVVYNTKVTATLAELNATKVLLANETGVVVRPIGITVTAAGAFLAGTAVIARENTDTSPKTLCSFAQANLTDGAKLKDGETGATRGAGISADLTSGNGIILSGSGAAFTGGTSLTFDIQYTKTVA